jgi:hypothetical protein
MHLWASMDKSISKGGDFFMDAQKWRVKVSPGRVVFFTFGAADWAV